MPQEGWEFFILDPTDKSLVTKQNIQDKYNKMYITLLSLYPCIYRPIYMYIYYVVCIICIPVYIHRHMCLRASLSSLTLDVTLSDEKKSLHPIGK